MTTSSLLPVLLCVLLAPALTARIDAAAAHARRTADTVAAPALTQILEAAQRAYEAPKAPKGGRR